MCHLFVLLLCYGLLFNYCNAATLICVTEGKTSAYMDTLIVNSSSGVWNIAATHKIVDTQFFFSDTSCYDALANTFYYTGSEYIYIVDLSKHDVSTFKLNAETVATMIWDPIAEQLLMALEYWNEHSYGLYHVPITGTPTKLINLTALGFGIYDGLINRSAFDAKNRIFYTVSPTFNRTAGGEGIIVQEVNIYNISTYNKAVYKCAQSVWDVAYDSILQQLVGVGVNCTYAKNGTAYCEVFIVTIKNNECVRSKANIIDWTFYVVNIISATYDENTSTYYIGYGFAQNFGIYTVNVISLEASYVLINFIPEDMTLLKS